MDIRSAYPKEMFEGPMNAILEFETRSQVVWLRILAERLTVETPIELGAIQVLFSSLNYETSVSLCPCSGALVHLHCDGEAIGVSIGQSDETIWLNIRRETCLEIVRGELPE